MIQEQPTSAAAGDALEAGWRAFRAHPWALAAGQAALLALGLWAGLWALATYVVLGPGPRANSAGEWIIGLALLLVGLLPWWLAWVGLAVPLGAALVLQVVTVAVALAGAVGGFAAQGVGQEMGRVLVADLPAGFAASPGYQGGADWFGLLEIEGGQASGLVEAPYTITNTAGTPYYFKVVRYFRTDTAQLAFARLQGARGQPLAGLGDAAVVVRYPAVVRLAARAGDTVLAAEGPATGEAELRDLLARQLARLDLARDNTAAVYRWLPKAEQRLGAHPMAHRTQRAAPSGATWPAPGR